MTDLPMPVGATSTSTSTDLPMPVANVSTGDKPSRLVQAMRDDQRARGAEPAPTPQRESWAETGTRALRHMQQGFDDTFVGALGNSANLSGAKEDQEINYIQNKIRALEATPGWLGGPDKEKIAAYKEKIMELTGKKQQSMAAAKATLDARKAEFAKMKPAEGFVENAAAVAGHLVGSLPSPENLVGGPGVGAAKTAAKGMTTLLPKVMEYGKEALKGGTTVAGVTAVTEPLKQAIDLGSGAREDYSTKEASQRVLTGFIGGTIFTGIFGQFAKPMLAPILNPGETAIAANRADRAAALLRKEELGTPPIADRGPLINPRGTGDQATSTLTNWLHSEVFDWRNPVTRIQQEAGKGKTILEKSIDDLADPNIELLPTDLMQLNRGTSGQVKIALEDGTFLWNTAGNAVEKTGDDSLIKILKDLGPNANSFLEYVAALRAAFVENSRGIKTGFDPARTQAIINEFAPKPHATVAAEIQANPSAYGIGHNGGPLLDEAVNASTNTREAMNRALGRYQQWTDWLLDYQRQAGLYSNKEMQDMVKKNPAFIPFYHIDETTGRVATRTSAGKSKALKGSELDTNDLAENLAKYTARSIEAANNNRMKQSLYDMIETMPGGAKYATRDKVTWAKTAPEIIRELQANPKIDAVTKANLQNMTFQDLRSLYFKEMLDKNKDVVFRNGEAHIYSVHDKALVGALKQLTPTQLWVNKLSLKSLNSRLPDWGLSELKGGITSLITHNPGFAMVSNPLRDSQAAYIAGKTHQLPVVSQIRTMLDINEGNSLIQEFYLNGGGFASLAQVERNSNLNKLYVRAGIDFKRDVLHDENALKALKNKYMETMEQFEQASRVGEYTRLTKEGVPGAVAALAGREITTDFAGHGGARLIKELRAVTPFLGAALNATNRFGRRLDQANLQETLQYGTHLLIAAVSIDAINEQFFKKEHDALPDWIRDTHLPIPIPKIDKDGNVVFGKWAYLPLDQSFGYSFGSIPRSFLAAHRSGDYNELARGFHAFASSVLNVFQTPLPERVAQLGASVGGVADPKIMTRFTGAPVIPKRMADLEPMAQSDSKTSSLAVSIGREYNISPKVVEEAINIVPMLGPTAMFLFEKMPGARDSVGRNTAPAMNIRDIPMIGRVIDDTAPRYGKNEEEFYRLSKIVQTQAGTMGLAKSRMDFDKLYKKLSEHDPNYGKFVGFKPTITDVQKQITAIDNTINLIRDIKDKTPAEKRDEINKLGWIRSNLMAETMKNRLDIKIDESGTTVRDKIRPQGVIPFLKTLATGTPHGYAEGGLVERESWDGSDEEPMTVNPDFKLPDQFLGQEVRSAPEETVGGEMTNAMNAGLTGRSYPDVGPRSFLLPFQYNEFTGQYEFAMPGIMDAFPIGGGPVPAGGATSNALIGISRMPKLWHGSRAADEIMDSMGFRKGKSAERNKPGTSTSVDPHVSTLRFADSPEGLLHARVPKGNNEGVNPHTQVRNIDPFTYAIAAEAEEIPGLLVESKPAWPFKEFELFFKGKKQKYKHPWDSDESVHEPSVTEQPLSGQERLYPERNEQTRQIALAARKRTVQLDDLNGEIYKGFKTGDERHALESIQKAWKLAKGYPRLEMRVLDEGLQYLEHINLNRPIESNEFTKIDGVLSDYKMHRKGYDDFIQRVIKPNKVQLKKAVDENKWNIASKEDIQIPQMKKISEYEPNKSFSQWAEDTSKPRLSVRQIANETNDRYRAMMRAKDQLTQAIEKADPSKIKRITRNPDPKNYTKVKDADFYESNKIQAEGFEHPPYGEFDEYNPATGKWETVLGPEDIADAKIDVDWSEVADGYFLTAKQKVFDGNKAHANEFLHEALLGYKQAMSQFADPKLYSDFHKNLDKSIAYILNGFTDTQQQKLILATSNIKDLLSLDKKTLGSIVKSQNIPMQKTPDKSNNLYKKFKDFW